MEPKFKEDQEVYFVPRHRDDISITSCCKGRIRDVVSITQNNKVINYLYYVVFNQNEVDVFNEDEIFESQQSFFEYKSNWYRDKIKNAECQVALWKKNYDCFMNEFNKENI